MGAAPFNVSRSPGCRLAKMEAGSREIITEALAAHGERPLIAYSGGKDSVVIAHMLSAMGVTEAVCEESFVFADQIASTRQVGRELGLSVTYVKGKGDDWLRKNNHIIFTSDSVARSKSFQVRHQRTIKRHAAQIGASVVFFGRRRDENSVKASLYEAFGRWQCHPLAAWTLPDIWAYFDKHGITVPWIYKTRFGQVEGNAPFYTMKAEDIGGHKAAWDLVTGLDPAFTPERYGVLPQW